MSLIIFEDEHLLIVNKPAGFNTHAPGPFAGEGMYEWLKNREPRWANLAIIHRLDKETSGLIVFGKTQKANQSLTAQFEQRAVHKKYVLLTDRTVTFDNLTAKSSLIRLGDKYVSRPIHAGSEVAETVFLKGEKHPQAGFQTVIAQPLTGKTHQIRVHAAEHGFPILGDTFYGGSPAPRVCLHAAEIQFCHPASGEQVVFSAPPDFFGDSRLAIRTALIDQQQTNAFRLIQGAADSLPGLYVDLLGDYLLSQSESALTPEHQQLIEQCIQKHSARGAYHKMLRRQVQKASVEAACPQLVAGENAPEEFFVRENGIQFALRFTEGYSVGLFLDQRENRRRLLANYVASDFFLRENANTLENCEVLNTFAYTCGFSVVAAKAGAHVTSLDLSKKYLDWGKHNFTINALDPNQHDFIFGDAFEWMRRLAKKGRSYDVILLDPPTFSRSKERGVFQAEKNYGDLVTAALPLLKPNGVLFASTNAATLQPDEFLGDLSDAVAGAKRKILKQHYVPQPPDFPLHRSEPAYLKTVWMRIG